MTGQRAPNCLLVLLLLISAPALPERGGVNLEWNWKKGREYRYRTVTRTEILKTESESSEPESESGQSVVAWHQEILGVSRKGVATIEWTYEVGEGAGFLVGKPMTFRVDREGVVVQTPDLTGVVDGFWKEARAEALGGPVEEMDKDELEEHLDTLLEMREEITGQESGDEGAEEMSRKALVQRVIEVFEEVFESILPASLIEEMTLQAFRDFFGILPGRRVAVGDRWKKFGELRIPILNLELQRDLSYSLESVESVDDDRIARVSVRGSAKMAEPQVSSGQVSLFERLADTEMTPTVESSISGHYDFSLQRGCLVESKTVIEFKATMKIADSEEEMQMEMEIDSSSHTILVGGG